MHAQLRRYPAPALALALMMLALLVTFIATRTGLHLVAGTYHFETVNHRAGV